MKPHYMDVLPNKPDLCTQILIIFVVNPIQLDPFIGLPLKTWKTVCIGSCWSYHNLIRQFGIVDGVVYLIKNSNAVLPENEKNP